MTRILLAYALVYALVQAQDVAESHPARVVDLPVSDQATALDVSESIVIDVFRAQDAPRSSGSPNPLANWRVAAVTGIYDAADRGFEQRLTANLGGMAKSAAGTRTVLVVRADARAPCMTVLGVLESLAAAKLPRVSFEMRSPEPARRALNCPLPGDDDPADPEGLPDIRMIVAHHSSRSIVRMFDINPKFIPTGADGDAQLDRLFRTKHEDYAKLWKVPIPVVVECSQLVPWQEAVDLVSLARRAGAKRIEFARHVPAPPERADKEGVVQPKSPDVAPSPGEPASRPVPEISAPAASHATELDPTITLELWIFPDTARSSAGLPPWRLQAGGLTFAPDDAGFRGLAERLALLGGAKPPKVSYRRLVIRADSAAPWKIVMKTIEMAAVARIYRIHLGVASNGETLQGLKAWIPVNRGEEAASALPEIRIVMSWDGARNALQRIFGQNTVVPSTPGNTRLEGLIRAVNDDYRKAGKQAPTIFDIGPSVPYREVVTAVDAALGARSTQIQFGMPATPH